MKYALKWQTIALNTARYVLKATKIIFSVERPKYVFAYAGKKRRFQTCFMKEK